MTHGSLFSGIGGFDLAAEWMGWENVFHCEINPFGRKVLHYYWPNAKQYDDIKTTDFTIWRGKIDVLSGGFPCQPYSTAGKRLGDQDDRHLWPEMLRAIREISPRWVVGENVRGLTNWNGGVVFDEVQADLETEGYEVLPFLLPACGVGAPHRRDRIWFVAHATNHTRNNGTRNEGQESYSVPCKRSNEFITIANTANSGYKGWQTSAKGQQYDGWGQTRCEPPAFSGSGITPYASNQGFQGGKINGDISGERQNGNEQLARLFRANWEEFPTQPPIRSRNDGLSPQLVGITFSKHRRR